MDGDTGEVTYEKPDGDGEESTDGDGAEWMVKRYQKIIR